MSDREPTTCRCPPAPRTLLCGTSNAILTTSVDLKVGKLRLQLLVSTGMIHMLCETSHGEPRTIGRTRSEAAGAYVVSRQHHAQRSGVADLALRAVLPELLHDASGISGVHHGTLAAIDGSQREAHRRVAPSGCTHWVFLSSMMYA